MRNKAQLSKNTQGILCLVGSLLFLTISDSIIKWLSPFYPLHQITLFRAIVAIAILLIFAALFRKLASLRTARPKLHLLRGLLMVLANVFFFLGLSVMPLTEVVILFYTAPLFICILAKVFLNEVVGLSRWAAIAFGLLGVIIVGDPRGGELEWTLVLPILAALTYSFMTMMTRRLGISDSAGALTLYVQVSFILVSVASGLLIGNGRFDIFEQATLSFLLRAWQWPSMIHLQLLAACGIAVAIGVYLLSQSYRIAQASAVAPFEYASLPFAISIGYLVWGDLPSAADYIGSTIIIASGLMVVYLEPQRRKYSAN